MSVSRPQFFPAALAAHSVESLYAMHGREHSWIYWLSLCGISAAIGALPLVSVDLTVRSGGVVRPASERVELKAAVSGRIARVLVRDNDRVEAGQVLLELTARDAEERLAHNRDLQREKADVVADLVELTSKLVRTDQASSSISDLQSVHVSLTTRLLTRGHAQFLAQLEASRLALGRARRLRERTAALSARGIVTDQERDEAIYAYDRAAADLQLLVQQILAGWQSELRDEQTALGQLVSEQNRLKEELTLSTLRAPATGTLQGLNGLDAGSYVMGGQSLGYVSPDDQLLVETYVSPKDIGLLHAGLKSRLQIDAYPYTQWGMLDGVIESVAADAISNGSQAVFKVLVRPAAFSLWLPTGATGALRKGMTLTARFVVARRSLLQVLYEDATGWLDPQSHPSPS